jgi:phytoene/squalene synthetase
MTHNQREIFDIVSFKASKTATQAYSTSFSAGIRLLHQRFQNAIYGVYGFVRYADEIVDTLHEFNKEELMRNFRRDALHAIEHKVSLNPILHAFQMVYHEYNFDFELVDRFLISMEMDLDKKAYHTQEEYQSYIYGSAEVVGLMCLAVFCDGNNDYCNSLIAPARALGSAFQKINFLRDLKEDYVDLKRTYFPNVDFDNLSESDKEAIILDIDKDFQHGLEGIRNLPLSSRFGVYTAYNYYYKLFEKIKKVPAETIQQERIRIPDIRKFFILLESYLTIQLKRI